MGERTGKTRRALKEARIFQGKIVIVNGMSSAGKTTLGKALQRAMARLFSFEGNNTGLP